MRTYDLAVIAPSGIVTFLFTDIEGSTRRWEADAEAMRAALAAHDEVMRQAVDGHRGWMFKHTGDGVCAVFDSPRSAVDAAVAAQRALKLPVRMGVATGEAELRGEDYFGAVLNRAARVMAAGHGGQILLDGATAELLTGVGLSPLGRKHLRDIARPVELFQVRAEGLRAGFPPLKTAGSFLGNLPRPANTFVGRETELAVVTSALASHRLVTLTGVGGVGKTRLALEAATRCSSSFDDGVFVIELAAVSDPAAAPEAVAAVLGIAPQPGATLSDSIATALENRSRLLVLDNCEHILDATAQLVESILYRSTTATILATSREGLGVAEEHLYLVPPLDVSTAAPELFADRALAAASPVSPASDAAAVKEICKSLDGIPLAIELAASRLRSMTVMELRDRLDDRFRILVRSHRGGGRHQTLRHAVEWSYDLLHDAEKHMLSVCSVFAGGFDLSAACAVSGCDDELTTLDLLDALVRKSLLVADRSLPRTRFSMLETIRQFSEEQLASGGRETQVRTAHARHYASREAEILTIWDGPRQREAYLWVDTELANLRAAFRWAADAHDLDAATAIAVYPGFLGGWIELHEPSVWAEELIEPARAASHRRLGQLYVIAANCYRVGRLEPALRYADAAIRAIDSGFYDPMLYGCEPTALGGTYITLGMADRWLSLCRNRFARGVGGNLFNRGSLVMALMTAGEIDEAKSQADHLIADVDSTDNPGAKCFALLAYGYARRDDERRVYDALRRGLAIAQDSGNRMAESYLAVNLSPLAAEHGDLSETLDLLTLAVRNLYESGTYSHMVSPLGVLATCLHRIGRFEQAATILGFATSEFTVAAYPEIGVTTARIREALGDSRFRDAASAGATMTSGAMARYALEQIDLARAALD